MARWGAVRHALRGRPGRSKGSFLVLEGNLDHPPLTIAASKMDIPAAFNYFDRSLLAREVVLCKQYGIELIEIR